MEIKRIYRIYGDDSMTGIQDIMKMFRYGFRAIGGFEVVKIEAPEDLVPATSAASAAVVYRLAGGASVTVGPSANAPELEVIIRTDAPEPSAAEPDATGTDKTEPDAVQRICADLESIIYMDHGAHYCCE